MSKLTREEIARREIGHTEIRPALAWTMVVAFLGSLVSVPTIQLLNELQQQAEGGHKSSVPSCARIIYSLPSIASVFVESNSDVIDKCAATNAELLKHINEYEDQLEDESWLARRILSPTQLALTRWGGAGNEKAYVGRSGWLFYRAGVDYVTGPGFLDPATLAKRAASGNEYSDPPQPDPRAAILEFHRQLADRGIQLVVMPTPVKPMLEPEHFSSRYADGDDVLQNVSYPQFKRELEEQGILVFDPAPALLARKKDSGRPQYLKTDTHWTPAAMEFAAGELTAFLQQHVELEPRPSAEYRRRSREVANFGDITVMMQLPDDQTLFPRQPVTIHEVVQPNGALWEPDSSSDVLLLGDSFTNIYSLAGMQWGESAGFAEQLSFQMQRSIDRIAQNDAGAYATRQALALELARGNDRLAGKRVVVWQFAMRELAVGDWKSIPMNRPKADSPKRERQQTPPLKENEWLAQGTVVDVAGVPKPGSVPYRDAVTAIHLSDVKAASGESPCKDIVVYTWGMRENKWTDAARFQHGQQVQFKLTNWDKVQDRYGRFTRLELDDPMFVLIDLPTYWAEEVPLK